MATYCSSQDQLALAPRPWKRQLQGPQPANGFYFVGKEPVAERQPVGHHMNLLSRRVGRYLALVK
jgi:hypothetical protein